MAKIDLCFELKEKNGKAVCINSDNKMILFSDISKLISEGIRKYSGYETKQNEKVYNSNCSIGSGAIVYKFFFKSGFSKDVLTLKINVDDYGIFTNQVDILQKYHEKTQQIRSDSRFAMILALGTGAIILLLMNNYFDSLPNNKTKSTDKTTLTQNDQSNGEKAMDEYISLYREIGIKLYGENFAQNITPEMDKKINDIVDEILRVEQEYQKKL